MDHIWQWAWDRYGPRYSWAIATFAFATMLPPYLFWALMVVGVDRSHRFVEAAAIAFAGVAVMAYLMVLPGNGRSHLIERWAAGQDVDRAAALNDSYIWGRAIAVRGLACPPVAAALLLVFVGSVNGANGWQSVEFGVLGMLVGIAIQFMGVHGVSEQALRPVRAALSGDLGIGDSLPRARPSFAAWSNVAMLGTTFAFSTGGAILAGTLRVSSSIPLAYIVIGCVSTLAFVPLTIGAIFSPSMLPIRDLAAGTERVAAGDYSQRLPVVQDDDLGALAASFNRMQAGLAERERLQAAFGTYVDPTLASRLLEQGDDVFTGERREVTVMFVDIRDFTPFAEANTAEDTVARLNALFEIVVPAVVNGGGHVNKFLGDGALAVFGAPNNLANHADAAVNAAVLIQRLVAERFGGDVRIGIGINTGAVIAGTIGGGSKLEFTLIGDAVNVAARIEQLTKSTGDAILLTEDTVDALASRLSGLTNRGPHALKGRSTAIQVFGLDPKSHVS